MCVCVCMYDYNVDGKEMFGGGVKGFCGNYKNPFSQYIGHSREQCTEYGRITPPHLTRLYNIVYNSTARCFPTPLSQLASALHPYTLAPYPFDDDNEY